MINSAKLKDLTTLDLKPIRDGFGEGFTAVGAKNPEVVGLCADLTESVRMADFERQFPDRFLQVGICEQNMAGVAVGLALSGKIAYIGSFATFSPGRNYDQIRISVCMMNSNVKIVSSHAGLSHGEDGMTVQMLEDIALMRALPNMKVVVPADSHQAMQATMAIADIPGPVYLRLGRSPTPVLFDETDEFEFGKIQMLRPGTDLTIFACGYLVFRSLLAADRLSQKGINAQVINVHTIKPLDEQGIIEAVSQTGAVVTAEEAQIYGGLGGAVAETLGKNLPVPLEMVAVMDRFGQSGSSLELSKARNIMEDDIFNAAMRVFSRKHNKA
jgi:transketolase